MKNPIIRLSTEVNQLKKENIILCKLLYALGFQISNEKSLEDLIKVIESTTEEPRKLFTIWLNDKNKPFGLIFDSVYNNEFYIELKTIGDFIQYIIENKNNSITVKLNASHEAIVTKDGVKVGCQDFTHSAIRELAKAIETVTKQQ